MVPAENIKLVEQHLTSLRGEKRAEFLGEAAITAFKTTPDFEHFEIEQELTLPDGVPCLRGIQFTYAPVTYALLVSQFVRLVYDLNAELAILRQRDSKPEEFQEYNEYVEYCKLMADEYVTFVDNLNQ